MNEPVTECLGPSAPRPVLRPKKEKLLLWVDGVGGFLVCLADRILLGHAALDGDVDVPILADISRQHAWVERQPEGYFLEAMRPVRMGQEAVTRSPLRAGDKITLGKSCQFVFSQPVPLSASARLDLVSGHRLWRALQGVLVMAEALALGPGPEVHVRIDQLPRPLMLFRQKNGLGVRYPGKLSVNDQPCSERCSLDMGAIVTADNVSLTLECFDR